MTAPGIVDYCGVRFTRTHVALLDEEMEVVTIPLDSITALSLRRGWTAQRPLLGVVLSVPAFLLGGLAVRRMFAWLSLGGTTLWFALGMLDPSLRGW